MKNHNKNTAVNLSCFHVDCAVFVTTVIYFDGGLPTPEAGSDFCHFNDNIAAVSTQNKTDYRSHSQNSWFFFDCIKCHYISLSLDVATWLYQHARKIGLLWWFWVFCKLTIIVIIVIVYCGGCLRFMCRSQHWIRACISPIHVKSSHSTTN